MSTIGETFRLRPVDADDHVAALEPGLLRRTARRHAVDEQAPGLFTQRAVGGVGEEGIDGRTGIGDHPALYAFGFGGSSGGIPQGRRQSCQFGFRFKLQVFIGLVGQYILAEAGKEAGQFLVDLGKPGFLRCAEVGACPHKIGIV